MTVFASLSYIKRDCLFLCKYIDDTLLRNYSKNVSIERRLLRCKLSSCVAFPTEKYVYIQDWRDLFHSYFKLDVKADDIFIL